MQGPLSKIPKLAIVVMLLPIFGCSKKPLLWDVFNESQEDYWVTPLTASAFEGDLKSVERILAKGTPPDGPRTKQGQTALWVAVERKHYSIIETLVKAGADPMSNYSRFSSPIREAVILGDLVSFQLMQNKSDLTRVSEGKSLLWWACAVCQSSHQDTSRMVDQETTTIVGTLLKAGCKPDSPSPEGETPIQHAASWNKFEVIRLLFEAGADPYYSSKKYGSAYTIIETTLTNSTKALNIYQKVLQIRHQGDKQIGTVKELKQWIEWDTKKIEECSRILILFKTKQLNYL